MTSQGERKLVFQECKEFGDNELEGFIMYCLYKNDWVVYQQEHPNWNEDDKRTFQNGVTGPILKKYHKEAVGKIESFITPFVQDTLTELDIKHKHRVEIIKKIEELGMKLGKFFAKRFPKACINILISAVGSFLAIWVALYLKGHWDVFREFVEQAAVK